MKIEDQKLAFYDDSMYLPIQYKTIAKMPFFEGKGNHSVMRLEEICEQFKEYCHQQQIIKQNLMKIVVDLKFNKQTVNNNQNEKL